MQYSHMQYSHYLPPRSSRLCAWYYPSPHVSQVTKVGWATSSDIPRVGEQNAKFWWSLSSGVKRLLLLAFTAICSSEPWMAVLPHVCVCSQVSFCFINYYWRMSIILKYPATIQPPIVNTNNPYKMSNRYKRYKSNKMNLNMKLNRRRLSGVIKNRVAKCNRGEWY